MFYYAGYSNPFSENEEDNYVIVGASRIKKIDDFHYYENTTNKSGLLGPFGMPKTNYV